MPAGSPLSKLLSHALVAFTIELDNEFEWRFREAGGGARVTSLVMWSNFLRFVGDGIAVGELPAAAGLSKSKTQSTVGGMERWGYVFVGPEPADRPPAGKRDGYGSSRALRSDWVVRRTPAGRTAAEIWRELPGDIEKRWRERFGGEAIRNLRGSLEAMVDELDLDLPEFLPILGSANGMAVDLSPAEGRSGPAAQLPLYALLAQVLLAYTIDYERESEVSLPLSANFVRVLDDAGMSVRDLPVAAGVSKEATSVALTSLTKTGYVVAKGATAATKVARLTPKGREAQQRAPEVHAAVVSGWETKRLRDALDGVLAQRAELSRGLEPHPDGWRASKPYLERTQAVLDDPAAALPHYPMVLYRGGWPDGS